MEIQFLLIVGGISGALVILIVALVVSNYSKKEIHEMAVVDPEYAFEESAESVGKTYPMRIMDPFPTKNGASGYLELALEITEAGCNQFAVVIESGLDRFAKRMGISEELEIGDESFDKKFYLISPINEEFRRYFSNSENKRVLERIFEAGVEVVGCDGRTIGLIARTKDREEMKNHTRDLVKLLEGVPRDPTQPVRKFFSYRSFHRRAAESILGLSLLFMVLLNAFWLVPRQPFSVLPGFVGRFLLVGSVFGLLAAIPILFWRQKKLKHNAFAHYSLIRWASVCISFLPLSGVILLGTINETLDQSATHTVPAYVAGVSAGGGKEGPRMYLAWYRGDPRQEVRMVVYLDYNHSYQRASQLIGKWIPLKTKSGLLGFPWLLDYELKAISD